MLSPVKTEEMHRAVARHLGDLKRQFDSRLLDEEAVKNGDETHVMVNMDNGRCLAAIGDAYVKYADVVSGRMGMTLFVRLSGGATSVIMPGFDIFQSAGDYPIRGVEDNIPGVSYRVGPKVWMDRKVMAEYFGEKRAIWPLQEAKKRILYVDNCGGHNNTTESEEALRRIRTTVRYLPPNSTHLIQPCDSFIIQKLKDEFHRR
jgi:DDE superfamily endonuclease